METAKRKENLIQSLEHLKSTITAAQKDIESDDFVEAMNKLGRVSIVLPPIGKELDDLQANKG